ncbi:hypothetical protein [Glycomyces buryatensis]|uniref:Uncharacterized protein n=1 Tax=Glycomyces buryatensis TaxID=2570927 RepID=A0A4S8Q926_9ACTN|nr:hypothetical protein [Glycomyces buryatensis]THV40933.1 hypothetical protein FAB82_13875 [Glycomyces buryatensis]
MPAPVQNADGSWTIHMRSQSDWNGQDFQTKADHLQQLGKDGKLEMTVGEKVSRSSHHTRDWRTNAEEEILNTSADQAEVNRRIATLDSQQIDHLHELQLGGKDGASNLWALDAATNHGMGGQINGQLQQIQTIAKNDPNFKDGDKIPIKIEILPPKP